MRMTVDEYLKLPYAVDIRWDSDDELFVARVTEISECTGHGKSRGRAMAMALDNLRDWIEDALESGEKIPEPAPLLDLPSGKWVQRVPRSMHAELAKLALKDDVSLNQLVVTILARELGYRDGIQSSRTVDISASSDPSTAIWTSLSNEIAITKTWRVDRASNQDLIYSPFVDNLVGRLPHHLRVKESERHEKEADHESWKN